MIDDSVNLWLRSTTDRPSSPPSSKDDRAEWIVGDICEAIDCNGGLQFVVEAFGPLSVDVSDLALTLEQLPQVARTIDAGETEYEISFFREGVATTLFFEEEGEQVRLLRYDPDRDEFRITYMPWWATRAMLRDLAQTFISLAETRCPELAVHPDFRAWQGSIRPLLRARPELRSLVDTFAA